MTEENCGNCRYFVDARTTEMLGRCRRHSPVTITDSVGYGNHGEFPTMSDFGWCGEWEGKACRDTSPDGQSKCRESPGHDGAHRGTETMWSR